MSNQITKGVNEKKPTCTGGESGQAAPLEFSDS